jgi:hypothetical protein
MLIVCRQDLSMSLNCSLTLIGAKAMCTFIFTCSKGMWYWVGYTGEPPEPAQIGTCSGSHLDLPEAMECALHWAECKAPAGIKFQVFPIQGEC